MWWGEWNRWRSKNDQDLIFVWPLPQDECNYHVLQAHANTILENSLCWWHNSTVKQITVYCGNWGSKERGGGKELVPIGRNILKNVWIAGKFHFLTRCGNMV